MTSVLHTLFEVCNDITATRSFYCHALGLRETFFDVDRRWLTCQAGAVQIVFTVPDSPVPHVPDWARSPGWDGGAIDAASWVFRIEPEEFDHVHARLRAIGAPVELRTFDHGRLRELFTRDPLGKTVEVYAEREAESPGPEVCAGGG